MKSSTIAILIVAALSSLLSAAPQTANRTASADPAFARDLAQANVAEIELGRLAQKNASSRVLKDFGMKMVDDHTQMNNQLKEWARTNHVSLPTSPSTAQADQKRRLEGLSGQAFDRAYVDYMLSDHAADVAKTEKLSESTRIRR